MLAISEAMDKVVDCLHMPQARHTCTGNSFYMTCTCTGVNLGSGYRPQGQACSPVGFESDSRILQDLNDRQLLKFSAMPRVQPS